MKAIVLLSGGLDSATAMAIAKDRGYELYAISYRYGQKHIQETKCAEKLAKYYNVKEHKIIDISFLSDIVKGASALVADSNLELSEDRPIDEMTNIPTSYVPFRNTIMMSIAVSWAESIGAKYVFIGANALDYSGYPDCRPDYFAAFQQVIYKGTKNNDINVMVPLISMTKKDIILQGCELGVPYEYTWSCYKGGDKPCGTCDSCILRAKGFNEARIKDPLLTD